MHQTPCQASLPINLPIKKSQQNQGFAGSTGETLTTGMPTKLPIN
jgi:hypothetical protein